MSEDRGAAPNPSGALGPAEGPGVPRPLTQVPLFRESLLNLVTETMVKLRESAMSDDNGINKPIQKLIYDLGTVKELIRFV